MGTKQQIFSYLFYLLVGLGPQNLVADVNLSPFDRKESINIYYDSKTNQESGSQGRTRPLGVFDNPALASGLANGVDALNNSVTTLMDSIFYNLLDQDQHLRIHNHAHVSGITQRDVYDTADGKYVIVDTVGLGPRYYKELYKFWGLPLDSNLDITGRLIHIYLRTDGSRLSDRHRDSTAEQLIKNWFGIVPLLTTILPPSFNPNELYDPLNIIKIMFKIPTSKERFYEMDVGSIMSYSLSGGISLPIDFAENIDSRLKDEIYKVQELKPGVPYSLYVHGEHRINVLRRSQNLAWVGVSRLNTVGHNLTVDLSSSFFLLENTLPIWAGVPVKLIPIGMRLQQAKNFKYDQLYEFDLSSKTGQEHYEAAIKGDFSKAKKAAVEPSPDEPARRIPSIFHFSKDEKEDDISYSNRQNLLIASHQTRTWNTTSTIELTDRIGRLHMLKAKHIHNTEWSDLLVGKDSESVLSEAYINVNKLPRGEDDFEYVFSSSTPYYLEMTYQIQDRNTDSLEYRNYRNNLQTFTHLDLEEMPVFPIRDPEAELNKRRRELLFQPSLDQKRINHVPMTLGRFFSTAKVNFSHKSLQFILERSEDQMWQAFAKAYGLPPDQWANAEDRGGFNDYMRWTRYGLTWPLRIVELKFTDVDAIAEISKAVSTLQSMKNIDHPVELQDAFSRLLNSNWPENMVSAFIDLAGKDNVNRSIIFTTSARGNASRKFKDMFRSLDGKVIGKMQNQSSLSREQVAIDKLGRFHPEGFEDRSLLPIISRINLSTNKIRNSYYQDQQELKLRVYARNLGVSGRAYVYLKLEQSGRIDIGKLHLFEDTVAVAADVPHANMEEGTEAAFSVLLQGNESPVSSYMSEYSLGKGGEFRLTVGLSDDGKIWSEMKSFDFAYQDGALMKLTD